MVEVGEMGPTGPQVKHPAEAEAAEQEVAVRTVAEAEEETEG